MYGEELQYLIHNAPISIHCVDLNGTIIWVNQQGLDLLGYTREEYIGKPIMEFCPKFIELVLDVLKEHGAGSTVSDVPVRFKLKNGEIRDLLMDSNLHCKDDDTFDRILLVVRDDTCRKTREECLKTSKELKDKLLQEKNRFVSKLIHEIKTPVHIIKMSLAQDGTNVHDILFQINKMNTIVSNITHAIKFDDGKTIQLNKISFNLNRFLCKYSVNKGKDIVFRMDLADNSYVVEDKKYLKLILDELVENSMSRGTSCIIDVRNNNEDIMFRVYDNGPHIPEEKVHSVFQSYWMCDVEDSSLSLDNPGLGIGMNVAFNIVQCMGSILEVKSTPAVTCFQFVLSAESDDSIGSSTRSDSPTWESIENSRVSRRFFRQDSVLNGGNVLENGIGTDDSYQRHVLLVEDNTICQKVCKRLIINCGHTCEIASNGKIAVDMVAKDPYIYDIVFMDLRMPIMDGYEATRRILEINKKLPIVALSAEEEMDIETKIFDTGMICFIRKPASSRRITNCIVKYT